MADDVRIRLTKYLPRLFGYAVSLVRDHDRALDLVQECVVRVLGAKGVPPDETAFRAWLFIVMRNLATDIHRRDRYEPLERLNGQQEVADLWRFDDTQIAAITVRQGLAQLEAGLREIIALVDIAGFSYAEAAVVLEVPIGTVMSRLSRARRALLVAIDGSAVRPLPLRARARHGE